MRSKTSFFNCGLFGSNLKRFWPIFAAYFVILLFALPMQIMTTWYDIEGGETVYAIRDVIDASAAINAGLAVIVASAVFGFMYNQRSCGMIASLPVRRGSVFATTLVSGIVPVIAINLIIALISVIPQLYEPNVFAFRVVVIWFAVSSLQFIFFFGFAAITAVITGSALAFPAFYVIFNVLAVGIESAIREIFGLLVFGFSNNTSRLLSEVLSPVVRLTGGDGLNYEVTWHGETGVFSKLSYADWRINIIYCIVGVLLMIIALLLFRRRKMENCGDVVAIPALRPVFKYGVAICVALCFQLLLFEIFNDRGINGGTFDAVFSILYMAIGAFIGFFGSEMLLKKSFKVFSGNWGGFIAIVVLCVLFILGCVFDVFNVGNAPDNDQVESVIVQPIGPYDNFVQLEDKDNVADVIELCREIVENKNEHQHAQWAEYVEVAFLLKNGHTAYREYPVSFETDNYASLVEILCSDEAKEYYTTPDVPVIPENLDYMCFNVYDYRTDEHVNLDLTREQAADFFLNAYTPDVMADSYFGHFDDPVIYGPGYACIELQFIDSEKGYHESDAHMYFRCYIFPECENCIQWVKDNLDIDLEEYYSAISESYYEMDTQDFVTEQVFSIG